MKYETFEKAYYKDKTPDRKKYNQLYTSRSSNTDSTIQIPVLINDSVAFFVLTKEILSLSSRIYKKNAKLLRLSFDVPDVLLYAYTKKSIIDEIQMTNGIEGIHSTRREIQLAVNSSEKNTRFFGLAKKYEKIIDDKIPLRSSRDIRSLYNEMFLPEIPEKERPDGEIFRKSGVIVTDGLKEIHHGVEPERIITESIDSLLSWISEEREIPALIKSAIFHYIFGYIHPFYDGNGRMARFVSSYLLTEELNRLAALNLSNAIYENRVQYYKAFEVCNAKINKGDLTPFIIIFLEYVLKAVSKAIEDISESSNKLSYYSNFLNDIEYTQEEKEALYYIIQKSLFDDELTTYKWLINTMNKSDPTIKKMINTFENDQYVTIDKSGRPFLLKFNFDYIDQLN